MDQREFVQKTLRNEHKSVVEFFMYKIGTLSFELPHPVDASHAGTSVCSALLWRLCSSALLTPL